MGLGQYDSVGEYCGPHTASSVFLILLVYHLCIDRYQIRAGSRRLFIVSRWLHMLSRGLFIPSQSLEVSGSSVLGKPNRNLSVWCNLSRQGSFTVGRQGLIRAGGGGEGLVKGF